MTSTLDQPQLDDEGQPTITEGDIRDYVAAHAPDINADEVWRVMESEVRADCETNREALEHAIAHVRD
jgi:uncharacterized protein with HEPN domain